MIRAKGDFKLARGNLFRSGKKGVIWCRFRLNRRVVHQSTKRFVEAEAQEVAWRKYCVVRDGGDAVPRVRAPEPFLSELGAAYVERIGRFAHVSDGTARQNVQALARFCRVLWDKGLEEVRVSALTRDAVLQWREARRVLAGVKPSDENLRHNAQLNSELGKVRSVFGRQARANVYADWALPDLSGFLGVQRAREARGQMWVPIPAEVMARIDVAIGRVADARVRVALELARWCGLRSDEVVSCRRHWFEFDGERAWVAVIARDGNMDAGGETYRPKNRDRRVPVRAERARGWLEAMAMAERAFAVEQRDPARYLLPAGSMTERRDVVQRDACDVLAPFLPDRIKRLHELRKMAGSEVATRSGSIAQAAEFLGDTLAVAERYYARLLKGVEPL